MLVQLRRRAPRELLDTEPAIRIDPPSRLPRRFVAREIREDDDRELEPLGAVDRHHAHALGPLLDDRRVARLAVLGLLGEPLDEGAEGRHAGALGAPGEVHQARHVGERLLARRPDGEAGVRARLGQQPSDRVGDGSPVAPAMERAQHRERLRNLGQRLGCIVRHPEERVQ